jgi:tRNA threonylcarbamoyladenosine biosynthesis protein TsaB
MLILGVDTSARQGSIALAECQSESSLVLEEASLGGGAFSAQLIPQVAALLSKVGRTMRDLGGFAVVSGPGSFTGLRIGLAAVKGLAEILQKPIAPVSMLQLVAEPCGLSGSIWSALEAGRHEVYCAEYEITAGVGQVIAPGERLLAQGDFSAMIGATPALTPDPALADFLIAKGLPVKLIQRPTSGMVARRGWQKIMTGNTVSVEALEAGYLGRADNQIFTRR